MNRIVDMLGGFLARVLLRGMAVLVCGVMGTVSAAELVTAQLAPGGSASTAHYRLRASAIGGLLAPDSGRGSVRWAAGFPAQVRILSISDPIGPDVEQIRMELFTIRSRPIAATAPIAMIADSVAVLQAPTRGTLVGTPTLDGSFIYQPDPGQTGEDLAVIAYRSGTRTIQVRAVIRIGGDPDDGGGNGAGPLGEFLVAANARSFIQGETSEVRYEVRTRNLPGASWRFALVTGPVGAVLVDAADQVVTPDAALFADRVWVRWPLAGSPNGHVPITVRIAPAVGGPPAYWFDAIRIIPAAGGGG